MPTTNTTNEIAAPIHSLLLDGMLIGARKLCPRCDSIASLALDWQAHEGPLRLHTQTTSCPEHALTFPSPGSTPHGSASEPWRPDCPAWDERFAEFAAETGVECGPLTDAQRSDMRAEIDALVARAYDLTADELRFIFTDFSEKAVSPAYRRLVLEKFESL